MEFLDPRNDVAFKRLFGSEEHKNITISFLNSILELTGKQAIKSIDFLNNEQLPQMIGKKDNVLDVYCIDQSGFRYIVELQVERIKEFDKRMVFYGAKTYVMQLGKGRAYRHLAPVIALAITDFIMFPDKKNYKSIHQSLDNKTKEHDLRELTFAFVELPKFNKQEHELITDEDKWIYFMKEIQEKTQIPKSLAQDEFEEACHIVERMMWSEPEYDAYIDAFVRETDKEGARELAIEEGMAKGMIKGIAQGVVQGEMKKALEFARKMLLRGIAMDVIAEDTGLPIEEIKKLKI